MLPEQLRATSSNFNKVLFRKCEVLPKKQDKAIGSLFSSHHPAPPAKRPHEKSPLRKMNGKRLERSGLLKEHLTLGIPPARKIRISILKEAYEERPRWSGLSNGALEVGH
jgi:hypothetical protein